jgi:hypothetical protein
MQKSSTGDVGSGPFATETTGFGCRLTSGLPQTLDVKGDE